MTLPPFPELPTDTTLHEMQQRLLSLRHSLEKACQDLDEQIVALGGEARPATVYPLKPTSRPQPSQAHRDAAAEFTRRLFEADPTPVAHASVLALDPAPAPVESQPKAPVVVEAPARVIEATVSGELDPELERATLEELNNALSAAFEQISKTRIW